MNRKKPEEANARTVNFNLKQHLFVHTARAVSFTFLLSLLIMSYIYSNGLARETIPFWMGGITCILLFRLVISLLARKKAQFIQLYYVLLVGSGMMLGGLLGYFYWLYFDIMPIFERAILLLFLFGLSSGSTISMASSPIAFFGFILPMYCPITLRYFMEGSHESTLIAFVLVIYLFFLSMIYTSNRGMVKKNIELMVSQEQLNKQLTQFNHTLSIISITDELTQLANRRYLHERLLSDWVKAKQAQIPISLLMIDIDHFKVCNDHYGHLYGDECLKEVGMAIGKLIQKQTDLAARYGGDEFSVILYNATLQETEQIAQKILNNVAKLQIENIYSSIGKTITVSIGGVNMLPGENDDYTTLFNKADKALYGAKEKGRNTLEIQVISQNET